MDACFLMNKHIPITKDGKVNATHRSVIVTGIIGGLVSIEHGIFEVLQGTTPTNDMIIEAIGPAQRFDGGVGEMAMTILPNFLLTGIAAIIIGFIIITWVLRYIGRKYGSLGLFILTIMTLFMGGGIAFFLIAIINCMVSTRINKPLHFRKKLLPLKFRQKSAKHWVVITTGFVFLFILNLLIAIIGLRSIGIDDVNQIATILGFISIFIYLLSVISCFSFDIQKQIV